MVNLIGTYECKLDGKGRLMLPSAVKKQLSSILQDGFVLKRSIFRPCLELYPMNEWNNVVMEKLNGLNRFVKKNNDFIRSFTAGVKVIEMDVSGRILIPRDLHSFAGISKEVVLSSSIKIIEIWDKDKYEMVINETAKGTTKSAEEILGDKNVKADGLS